MKRFWIAPFIIAAPFFWYFVYREFTSDRSDKDICARYEEHLSANQGKFVYPFDDSRVYLAPGTIYTFNDDPDNEYRIVPTDFVVHYSNADIQCFMEFYDTEADAVAAGYRPYEYKE
jgi:hypothetical protein